MVDSGRVTFSCVCIWQIWLFKRKITQKSLLHGVPIIHLPPKECCFSDFAEDFFTSNFASKYSLSVMVNTGPHAHVCRHMCQQTLCLPGVHGYLLQAIPLRRTVPNWSFAGILQTQNCCSWNQMIVKMPVSESPTALYPDWRLRASSTTLLLLEWALSQNTCSQLFEQVLHMRLEAQSTGTQETTTHSFLLPLCKRQIKGDAIFLPLSESLAGPRIF